MQTNANKKPLRPVLFIGGGNMAGAVIRGALKASIIASHSTVVAEPSEERRHELSLLGVITAPDTTHALDLLRQIETGTQTTGRSTLVLAVKPQMLPVVVASTPELRSFAPPLVVSIMAGVTRKHIRSSLPAVGHIARVMPNLPISVGEGVAAIAEDPSLPQEDRLWVERVFNSGGSTVWLPEDMMDAFTAVAGSGPAYLFYLAESMERAAQAIGFEQVAARAIVRKVLVGAAALLSDETADPAALRAAVTSKGGTTHAACTRLDEAGVMHAFTAAISAARDRGRELSAG